MLSFFKKPKVRYVDVPVEHREEVCKRWDEMRLGNQSRRLRFWRFAEEICPELQGKCVKMDFSRATVPRFVVTE